MGCQSVVIKHCSNSGCFRWKESYQNFWLSFNNNNTWDLNVKDTTCTEHSKMIILLTIIIIWICLKTFENFEPYSSKLVLCVVVLKELICTLLLGQLLSYLHGFSISSIRLTREFWNGFVLADDFLFALVGMLLFNLIDGPGLRLGSSLWATHGSNATIFL